MAEYQIIREIGRGGMGCVYEAISSSGKKVALKKLDCKFAGNQEYRSFFDAEVVSLLSMNSSSVVKIVDKSFSDDEGNLYLPMEFVDGRTLEQVIRSQGPYSEDDSIKLMSKILDAIVYVHSKDCIHRDIKPSNIMLRNTGEICIIDFGIAKDMKTHTGQTIGRIVGTDGYMSPEQAKGDSIDSRTDIYSLGCLLYYLLTGKHAIVKKSNDYETVQSILSSEFPHVREINPVISEHIESVILKATNKNMLYRYQTAEAFKADLTASSCLRTEVLPRIFITVGRNKTCDIIYPESCTFISGEHLEIEFVESSPEILLLIDKSTNGTSVEGRKVHHGKIEVRRFANIGQMPAVYLAGRSDGELDWSAVFNCLYEKSEKFKPQNPNPPINPQPLNEGAKNQGCFCLIVGIVVLCSAIITFVSNH